MQPLQAGAIQTLVRFAAVDDDFGKFGPLQRGHGANLASCASGERLAHFEARDVLWCAGCLLKVEISTEEAFPRFLDRPAYLK